MTDDKRYHELASKWLNGTITEEEKSEFRAWYNAHVDSQFELPQSFASTEEELRSRILTKIRADIKQETSYTGKPRLRWAVGIAASILLFVSIGVYLRYGNVQQTVDSQLTQRDVQPGGNRAILMLADGRVIDLSADQSGVVIGEKLTYGDGTAILGREFQPSSDPSRLMCIATPKGGQYQIVLPDGSKVWLNSASSLKYPAVFSPDKREVMLEGEAYFEVTRISTNIPFKVVSKSQTVEVLGTQFNINAYKDEAGIKTTLVEGSVAVHHNATDSEIAKEMILVPGEQAVLTDKELQVKKVDTEEFTAWKDGYFYFNDATIQDVMRQFSRWYDVEIKYDMLSVDEKDLFVGKIPKSVSLATAIQVIKGTGVYIDFRESQRLVLIKDSVGD